MKTWYRPIPGAIAVPGTHAGMASEVYHADCCAVPSLSAGAVHTLITRSPYHAWFEHPRLNPEFHEDPASKEMDYGAAVHAVVLEGREEAIGIVRAKDYKSADAKAQRDAYREEGRYPVLEAKVPRVYTMRDALLAAIKANPDLKGVDLADGQAETVDIWTKGRIWKRSRPDWRSRDRRILLDLKTTNGSANPETWVRTMLGLGGDIQAVHYLEGNEETGGTASDDAKFIFAVQEVNEPHAVAFVGLPPEFIEFSRAKYREGCERWQECFETGRWPGYPNRICWVDVPNWAHFAWENRVPHEMMNEASAGMEAMYGDLRREKESGGVH